MAKREVVTETEIELGEVVRVSDPCYEPDTWCVKVVDNVLVGKYKARIEKQTEEDGGWGIGKPIKLIAEHVDYAGKVVYSDCFEGEIGVDSGQAGIFDEEYYQKIFEKGTETKEWEAWYDKCFYDSYIQIPNPNYLDRFSWIKKNHPEEFNKTKNFSELADKFEEEYHESDSYCMSTAEFGIANLDNKGVNSSTNYGDGSYDLYIGKNEDGKVVGFMIDFIGYCEEDEEEEEE